MPKVNETKIIEALSAHQLPSRAFTASLSQKLAAQYHQQYQPKGWWRWLAVGVCTLTIVSLLPMAFWSAENLDLPPATIETQLGAVDSDFYSREEVGSPDLGSSGAAASEMAPDTDKSIGSPDSAVVQDASVTPKNLITLVIEWLVQLVRL